jgi:hypothetical protein
MTMRKPGLRVTLLGLLATALYAAPVRIVVVQDKTGSANWTRTPQLSVADLDLLIELLRNASGELALGLIRDSSNRGLVRLRIDLPPAQPAKPVPSGRPFNDMRAAKAYRTVFAVYQDDLEKWRTKTEANIAAFKSAAQILLDQKANASATDVWGAVVRADRLLCEPPSPGTPVPDLWLLVASDLYYNTGSARPQELRSGARLIVVNAGQTASLAPLKPTRFEAIAPAFRYLIDTENGGK